MQSRSFTDIYMDMLQPLELSPVHERNWGFIRGSIVGTTIWPINVPYQIIKLARKRKSNTFRHGDQYAVMGAISAPFCLKESFEELVRPSMKGLTVSNIEQLLSEKIISTNLDNENPGLRFGYGKRNPESFGDSSSRKGKKGYIELVFPDELLMGEDSAFYPANAGNHYSSSKHFLKIDPSLKEELYDLVKQEGVLDLRSK